MGSHTRNNQHNYCVGGGCGFRLNFKSAVSAGYSRLRFFGGLMFASMAMCFTSVAPNIDFFNFPSFLFLTPMFFLCGTFFPLTSLPVAAQGIATAVLPLTHVVNITRGLVSGHLEPILGFKSCSVDCCQFSLDNCGYTVLLCSRH